MTKKKLPIYIKKIIKMEATTLQTNENAFDEKVYLRVTSLH